MAPQVHRRRLSKPGLPPGTLVADPEASPTTLQLVAYGPQAFEEKALASAEEARAYLDRFPVVWLNISGLKDIETIRRVGELFALHPLALEDVVNVHQRAKADAYPDYQFIVACGVNAGRPLDLEQLSFFIGRKFLLTFQERSGDGWEGVRDRIRQNKGPLRGAGPDYLGYALIDRVTDSFYPVLEDYGERLDTLEDASLAGARLEDLRELHRTKRDLFRVRRAVWPLREALASLMRDPSPLFSAETMLHFRDCYDHTVQIIDLLETYRELSTDLMDLQLSSLNNRMNEVMRVLTIIATIFIPITFIASVYGMNFRHMPELEWAWGYAFALALMAVVALVLLIWFWRKGWLRSFLPQNR